MVSIEVAGAEVAVLYAHKRLNNNTRLYNVDLAPQCIVLTLKIQPGCKEHPFSS